MNCFFGMKIPGLPNSSCTHVPTPPFTEENWEKARLEVLSWLNTNLTPDSILKKIDVIVTELISKEREKALNSDAIRELKTEFHRRGRTEAINQIKKMVDEVFASWPKDAILVHSVADDIRARLTSLDTMEI